MYTNIYLSKSLRNYSYIGGLCTSGGIIPNWNPHGVIEPIDPNAPKSSDRSPYVVSLNDFVLRFGVISPERLSLLGGLLSFRSALHGIGIVNGFQWIDGSFLENIEYLESRHPRDIDTVTFYYLPAGQTQKTLSAINPPLFNRGENKKNYHVHNVFIELAGLIPEDLISNTTYWYSLLSHRRNALWKGYLQIDLSPTDDIMAKDSLDGIMNRGGTP